MLSLPYLSILEDMTVSRRRYYWSVGLLVVIILSLSSLLVRLYLDNKANTREEETPTEKTERSFLEAEEVVVIPPHDEVTEEVILPIEKTLFEYIEVTQGCEAHFEGECLLVRSGPGTDYPVVSRLRNGVVLKVGGQVEHEGLVWYKVVFDEWLRYPERVTEDWFIAAPYVEILYDEGDKTVWDSTYSSSTLKKIVVDRSEQKLYAYEDDLLYMETAISTGLELTPTPRGTFTIFKKTPSRYMQGPLPGLKDQQYYDLPGVPWNLYFTHGGAVIHGAYWHNSFGHQYSHGCVNLPPDIAQQLYTWAELGTKVIVQD